MPMPLESGIEVHAYRKAEHPIDDLFLKRWSPRSLSGVEITEEELKTLFEAARWAPSSYNNQPWRFIYARRNTSAWPSLLRLLNEHNQSWAKQASALVLIASKETFDNDKPCRTHSFDTGSAWMALALQGTMNGWVVHGMEGFDYEKAREVVKIPVGYQIEAMAAIGRPGKKENLPAELQSKEFPNGRKKISEIAFEGRFR